MKKLDVKHIAYHMLVGVYFVWFIVFSALIAMALINIFNNGSNELSCIFLMWIIFNQIMGTALFLVLRLFRKSSAFNKVLVYTYYGMAAITVVCAAIIYRT